MEKIVELKLLIFADSNNADRKVKSASFLRATK